MSKYNINKMSEEERALMKKCSPLFYRYQEHYDEALLSFNKSAETIYQQFEYHLNDDRMCDVPLQTFERIIRYVGMLKELASNQRYYYDDNNPDAYIEYDFTHEVSSEVDDRFGWILEEIL